MGPVTTVTDAADARLSDYLALTDVELRTKVEPEHGIFIAEGELVIRRALRAGYHLRSAFMAPRWLDLLTPTIDATDAPVYLADDEVMEGVTGFHVHRGALASFDRRPLPSPAELLAGARRVGVLENVNNPTNLGVIVRSAAGLGMDGLLLCPRSCDHLYRRSIRVSMGEVFSVPVARLSPPWPQGLDVIREGGFRLLALTPDPAATPIDRLALGEDDRVALLFGAEGPGLSPRTLRVVDERVRIPMANGVDSLNVGAAAAVAFFAVGRRPA